MLLPSLRVIPRQKIPISLYFRNLFPAKTPFWKPTLLFVIFPSNRGGYCIQPQKKEYSMNYKCSFPSSWLGLEGEELSLVTGLKSAAFCQRRISHDLRKPLEDSVLACRNGLAAFHEEAVIVSLGGNKETDMLLQKLRIFLLPGSTLPVPQLPELTLNGIYGELSMEKRQNGKTFIKDRIKRNPPLQTGSSFLQIMPCFPCIPSFMLCRKHIPRSTAVEKRRTEASGMDPIRFLKDLKHVINCIYRYIHIAYLYRKKACLCEKKNLKWKDRGLIQVGDKVKISNFSATNYSYIIEPTVAMSGCYRNADHIRSKGHHQKHWAYAARLYSYCRIWRINICPSDKIRQLAICRIFAEKQRWFWII